MRMVDADKILSMVGNAYGNVSCKVLTEYINATAKEIIHCKDCIHIHDNDCPIRWARQADDYCSFGEKIKT